MGRVQIEIEQNSNATMNLMESSILAQDECSDFRRNQKDISGRIVTKQRTISLGSKKNL
jgi:hypothetical protein